MNQIFEFLNHGFFNSFSFRMLSSIFFVVLTILYILFPIPRANTYKLLAEEELRKLNLEQRRFFLTNTKHLKDVFKFGILEQLEGTESNEEILEKINKAEYRISIRIKGEGIL